jgi:hypothetical protein
MILVPTIIVFFDFGPCKFFCLDSVLQFQKLLFLVCNVTLLVHVAPHGMIILGHTWCQGLRTTIFEIARTKPNKKKNYTFTGT